MVEITDVTTEEASDGLHRRNVNAPEADGDGMEGNDLVAQVQNDEDAEGEPAQEVMFCFLLQF